MAKYDWKVEPRDEDWSDDTYTYFLIHINIKRMAEYLTKEFKKDWWFKADYGQDNCYIVAENNNFPVRLFFTFDEGGWADITRHYTDGATYKDDHLGSWHFGKYDVEYSYKVIESNIEEYFIKFEESMKEEKKSLTKRDDSIKGSDVKKWMINGGDIQITFKDGNELVGFIAEYRKDETDSKAECYLCEDLTDDYTGNYFIVEVYNGKIISIKFQSFDYLIDYMDKNDYELVESKKENKKSLKEYRTVGFEQLVRDTIVEVLENPHSDLFNLRTSDGIITYDNKGRARITSNGDVDMDFITLPTYFWSSGYTPSNKKTAKLVDDIIDMNMESARERLWDENKDELIELGITDKDDEKLNYNDLYDLGAGDLAEELSEYEMDMEGTDLYTDVYCQLEETDEGIELTVSMTVQDEYGHALVKDYKSNTVVLDEDKLQDEDDLTEVIEKAIREVTEQF